MTNLCSTCSTPTVWVVRSGQHVLVCPKPMCPGHDADASQLTPTEQEQAA